MQASPTCRIVLRPKTSLVSPRVNGKSQRTKTPSQSGDCVGVFCYVRARSPVVVFLRLDGYSQFLSATVSRLGMMFLFVRTRGLDGR